jgi:solute carrier family 6 amino acid transporter-like protein 5/7/9/14
MTLAVHSTLLTRLPNFQGGATFLIPYFIMLFLVGLPMFFLELVLGQYAGLGATKIYGRLTPGLRGLGFGMITIPTLINFYYVVIMAYALHFLFAGFTSTLPWSACGHDYNSDHCYSLVEAKECNINQVYYREKCTPSASFCRDFEYKFEESHPGYCINDTGDILPMADIFYRVSPSEEYWYGRVLHFNVTQGSVIQDESSWDNWGGIQWELVGCLGLGWIIIFIFLNNGIQSYGKVVYFTTLFPYVVLTILLGYVATLDGFDVGMEYYFVPRDWNDLWDISVWNAAAGQIFYSIGVALGTHLMLASYNNFNENVQRDAVLIAVSNSLTSIYAGLVVFGSLGYISIQKGVKIEDVIQSGPGLAFIVYPEAVTLMDVPPLFSFLFFFMVILLAISSVCATWEGMIGTLMDEFPQLRERRRTTVFVSCLVAFLCGLSMCFDSGFLMFFLLDSRVSNAILLLSFIELITISWFYGSDKVMDHVQEMKISMPKVLEWYWKVSWIAVSPAILFAVTVLFWAEGHEDQFLDYVFPTWVQVRVTHHLISLNYAFTHL